MAKLGRVFLGTVLALVAAGWVSAAPGRADDTQTLRGPVTNLPLPRFVSLKVDKGNVRRGPSRAHQIDWVFQAKGMPLEVISLSEPKIEALYERRLVLVRPDGMVAWRDDAMPGRPEDVIDIVRGAPLRA